jgi:outer membrane receptor protein involved in Fe transport
MNPVQSSFNYTAVGMPTTVQGILPQPGASLDFAKSPIGQWNALTNNQTGHKNEHQTNYHLAVSATKVKGNWTLKWGGEYLGDLSSIPNLYDTGGNIAADGCGGCQFASSGYASTSQNTTAATQGFPVVGDLMMGAGWWNIPNGQAVIPAIEYQYMGLYTQNTWTITPRLTLNLGLRWDLQPGASERPNQMVSFDPSATSNPICNAATTSPAGFGCQDAFYFAGLNGNSRHLWNTQYNNFGPRVGFAYRTRDTIVVRGGYGISFLPTNTGLLFGPYSYGEFPWGYGTTNFALGATPASVPIGPMENILPLARSSSQWGPTLRRRRCMDMGPPPAWGRNPTLETTLMDTCSNITCS